MLRNRWKSVALVPLVALAAVPALAQADRAATKSEAAAIAAAATVPASCLNIHVSTVNEAFASVHIRNGKASCRKFQADGVAVYKKNGARWKFVTAGSSFSCPVPKVPRAVARDLGITCHGKS